MQARLSIMGLYLYDNTIFDGFTVPAVDSAIYSNDVEVHNRLTFNKDAFLNKLLFECADMSCVYTNPTTVKQMITVWSQFYNYNWSKLMTTAALKYNPVWNVDANVRNVDTDTQTSETGNTTTTTKTKTTTNSGTDTTNYGKVTTGRETNTGDDITTYGKTDNITTSSTETYEPGTEDIDYFNQTAADRTETTTTKLGSFNSNGLATQQEVSTVHPTKVTRHTSYGVGDKRTGSGTSAETLGGTDKLTHGHTINDTETLSGADTFVHGHAIAESESESVTDAGTSEASRETIHTERKTGNIGVTMTQQMIEKEREIAVFSIYDVVIESFKENFCVLVY